MNTTDWIKVTDRMPKDDEDVLVYDDMYGVEVEVPHELKYYSVKSVATRIYNDFGCRFTFRQKEGKKYVKRLS